MPFVDVFLFQRATELAYVTYVHREDLYREGIFKCEGTVDMTVSPSDVSIFQRMRPEMMRVVRRYANGFDTFVTMWPVGGVTE